MKNQKFNLIRCAGYALLLSSLNLQLSAAPLGTAFTYQGRLADGGNPVSGSYDLRFAIYDAAASGAQIGTTLTNSATGVTNGLFTVALDFGANVFTGAVCWLEIGVRTNSAATNFTALMPRQELTPVPNALYAPNAGAAVSATTAATANGTATNAVMNWAIAPAQVVKSLNTLRDAVMLAAGANVTVTPAGQTLTFASPDDWHWVGNAGTTPGTHFVGTTDNKALELKANSQRALRLEPNTSGAPNVIGGAPVNEVVAGFVGATIGGGGAASYLGFPYTNRVAADFGTIGGGQQNSIQTSADYATIAGGQLNAIYADADWSTIGGGNANTIKTNADYCIIGGGGGNTIQPNAINSTIGGGHGNTLRTNTQNCTIGGGDFNTIKSGVQYATIAGGDNNTIETGNNDYSTIGGGGLNSIQAGSERSVIAGGTWNSIQASSSLSFIGGGRDHSIESSAYGAFIGGGTNNDIHAGAYLATITGGERHQIAAPIAFIGGGSGHTIEAGAWQAVIGGGAGNSIQNGSSWATIAGGAENIIRTNCIYASIGGGDAHRIFSGSSYAAIGGGYWNWASNQFTTIPGGRACVAAGKLSFASGNRAQALHTGAFVWADSVDTEFASTINNEVSFRCNGGVRFVGGSQTVSWVPGSSSWSFTSDRNTKDGFIPVDFQTVLNKVCQLPITQWNYKGYPQQHIGPVAQDFHALFPLNDSETTLDSADLTGVSLAAIQGLNQKVEVENAALRAENAELKVRLERLEQLINARNRGAK